MNLKILGLALLSLSLFLCITKGFEDDYHRDNPMKNEDMLEGEWEMEDEAEDQEEDLDEDTKIIYKRYLRSIELRNHHNITAEDRDLMYPLTNKQLRVLSKLCLKAYTNISAPVINGTAEFESCFRISMTLHE